jgi:hypothetical protein
MIPDAPNAPAAWSWSRWALLVLAAGVIAVITGALAAGTGLPDATYAPFSAARQMRAGAGARLPTADALTPAYPVLPSVFATLQTLGLAPDAAPIVLGAVASVVAAVCLVALGGTWWAALGMVVAAGLSGYAPDSVLVALALLGLLAADRGRWRVAGALIGVACGAHPTAFLLAALLTIPARAATGLARYLTGLVITCTLLLLPALLTRQPMVAFPLSWLVLVTLLLGLISFWQRPAAHATARLLPAWLALTVLLFPVGLTLPRSSPEATAAGAWIAANTSPQATLATTQLGALAYAANRPVTLGGNPPTTWDRAFFVQHAPAVVALPTGTLPAWADFATTYARTFSVGGIEVYQPVVAFTPLTARTVTHAFNGNMAFRRDLVLVGAALAEQVTPGQMVRVWLEWQLAAVPSFDLALTLSLQPPDSAAAPFVTHTDVFPPATWRVGTVRTYHLLPLPADLSTDAGEIAFTVGVNVRGGTLGRHEIARARLIR